MIYMDAARSLRQPYWDWASQPSLPAAVTSVNVTVNSPKGPLTIPNPLYSYRFQGPSDAAGSGSNLSATQATVRCRGSDGRYNATAAEEWMGKIAKSLAGLVVGLPHSLAITTSSTHLAS
jgi:hypothetical protein